MSLAERIRASRRVTIEIEHMKFHGSRPKVDEFLQLYKDEARSTEVVMKYIDGWEGVLERDCLTGGSEEPVSFTRELLAEMIGDRVDVSEKIVARFIEQVNEKYEERGSLEKNSRAGSSTSKSKNTRDRVEK